MFRRGYERACQALGFRQEGLTKYWQGQGFALFEAMVVAGIIGILAALAYPGDR
jgi:prepilin-type N-terminal cleavage/methylation domain-containing protein